MSEQHLQNPDAWATGGEGMTDKQAGFAQALANDAGVDFDPNMSKTDASKFIDDLKSSTSTGQSAGSVDDEATGKQKGYIAVLEKKADASVTGGSGLTKGQASDKIEELKAQTG